MTIVRRIAMKTMGAGAFKAKCLSIIDDVHANGGELIITKRGKPMAKLVPVAQDKKESVFGFLKGKVKVVGDIVSPIVEPWEWDEDIFPVGTPEREEFERMKKSPVAKASPRVPRKARK
jgi:prevent-host-death family protein